MFDCGAHLYPSLIFEGQIEMTCVQEIEGFAALLNNLSALLPYSRFFI